MFRTLLARVLATLGVFLLTAVAFATPAVAAEPVLIPATAPVAVAFTLDPAAVVQLLLAVVMPVLVGLVTTRVTSAGRKAWLLALLTLVTSLLIELGRSITAGTTYDLGVALLSALPAFVVSVSAHYGILKPTGISGAAQDVGAKHLAS